MTQAVATTVDEQLAELTLDEKLLLLEGLESWRTHPVPRLGIRSLFLTDGPHGVRKVRESAGGFGISDNEHSTAFPTSVTLGSTWNPELAERMGVAIGAECRALGVDVLLAPGVNIKRSPLCGRDFEYFSEDPLVSGVFGSAVVRGMQSQGVGASVKHFAANSNEDYRFVGDSVVDERALREIYLRAFERVVKEARPETVMCSYNQVNGTFASENRELLTGILREEWGFDGLVMTDWGATHDRVAGVAAGCDLDMPGSVPHNRESLREAVRSGALPLDVLDTSVARVLELVARHPEREALPYHAEAHAELAREIATEGAVLLANDGTLPLDAASGSLLVVGEFFERMRFQGAGSSLINPPSVVTPRDAFDARGISYRYEPGFRSMREERDAELETAALEAARAADTVLFFGGLTDLEESEGFDRTHLGLASNQVALVEALLDQGARVVLVLFAGAPVAVPSSDRLASVLLMNLPGMRGGEAAAALLFGEADPSGRLAESWPFRVEDTSAHADYDRGAIARYAESIYVGYRFYDAAGTPLAYPFGHGLSYTTFAYRDAVLEIDGDRVVVTATVANTGARDGAEVVQLYVRNAPSAVFKAEKELRAFAKVRVPAGGEAPVRLEFALADLAYWDVERHDWVLEDGDYEVLLAASAADIRARLPLTVTGHATSRSPYPAEVDRDYAAPPVAIPASFPALLGRPVPEEPRHGRLHMEMRLGDARRTLFGRIISRAIIGAVAKPYREALALPDSLERDIRLKNSYFLWRMMPSASMRSLAMSSGGAFTYSTAEGIELLAAGHPIRALRAFRRGRKAGGGA
ncbi:MAG: beta-glucosidase [Microbacteriaceae bacterium]|nr:MAG: beta-glucosidase [Microbacteriaceae bacterium]